ncbi:MAG: VanZ family protein [Acutalibacteraceae bacterium]|nr:VanZ family protein [Acutalibacteraceae bacterium]
MSKNQKAISAVSWILVAVCMSIIFALSHQPSTESAELSMAVMGFFAKIFTAFIELIGHDVFRSIAHALEYCGLGLILFNAIYHTTKQPKIFLPFLIGVLYSVTDEIHQIFIEGRAFQFIDIAVDALGSAVGVAAGYAIYKIICHFRGKKLEEKR